jgi:hypothetical protein
MKKKKKKKTNMALVVGLIAGFLLLVGGTALVLVLRAGGPTEQPQAKEKPPPVRPAIVPPKEDKQKKPQISTIGRRMEITEVRNWFKQMGIAYHQVAAFDPKGRGAANYKELGLKSAQVDEWFEKGWVTMVWKASVSNQPSGSSNTLLAWETDPDGAGIRVVLMCDGSVRDLSDPEFQKTPKAR